MRKQLFCVIGQLGNGGSEKQLYLFLKHLDRQQYDPTVVVCGGATEQQWESRILDLGVQVIALRRIPSILKLLYFQYFLVRHQVDIVFSWSFYTNVLYWLRGRSRFIGSLRGRLEEEESETSEWRVRLALHPKEWIVNSNDLGEELADKGVSRQSISVIHNIYESMCLDNNYSSIRQELRQKYAFADNQVVLSGVGRASASKDFPLWLEVFEKLTRQHSNVRALLIGSGPLELLAKRAREKGLSEKVVLTGEIPNAARELIASDVFFLSSLHEGLPNCVLEAIDAGNQIVTMHVPGVDDIFLGLDTDSYARTVLQTRDAETIARHISDLINHRREWHAWQNELRKCLDKFSPDNILASYNQLLQP